MPNMDVVVQRTGRVETVAFVAVGVAIGLASGWAVGSVPLAICLAALYGGTVYAAAVCQYKWMAVLAGVIVTFAVVLFLSAAWAEPDRSAVESGAGRVASNPNTSKSGFYADAPTNAEMFRADSAGDPWSSLYNYAFGGGTQKAAVPRCACYVGYPDRYGSLGNRVVAGL